MPAVIKMTIPNKIWGSLLNFHHNVIVKFNLHLISDVKFSYEAETNVHHFAEDIFKCIFLNENFWISDKI